MQSTRFSKLAHVVTAEIATFLLVAGSALLHAQRVGIGTSTPENRARLHVEDTERGIIIPRLTTAQRDAIPAADLTIGVIIYNRDCHRLEWWDGTQWVWVVTNTSTSMTTAPTALPPTGVTGTSFTANWSAVTGATAYQVDISTAPNFSSSLPGYPVTVAAPATSYTATGLACGLYYYRVRAVGGGCGGTSNWSNVQEVLVANLPACPGPDTWVRIPDPPATMAVRHNQVAVALGTKIYVGFGGSGTVNCLNDWWEWDACTGNWTQRASPPSPQAIGQLPFAFAIGNQIYVGGGGTACGGPFSNVYRYDPATDSWTAVAPLPEARHGAPGASDGRYGYVLGGYNGSTYTNTLYRYDPVSNSWTTLASYPQNVWTPYLTHLDGTLYAGQGHNPCTNSTYRYDIATNTWTATANHPFQGHDGWGVTLNGQVLVVGQRPPVCDGNSCTNQFYRYSPSTNSWTAIALFPGGNRNNPTGAVIGGRYFGGFGDACSAYPRDWWMYCPNW